MRHAAWSGGRCGAPRKPVPDESQPDGMSTVQGRLANRQRPDSVHIQVPRHTTQFGQYQRETRDGRNLSHRLWLLCLRCIIKVKKCYKYKLDENNMKMCLVLFK